MATYVEGVRGLRFDHPIPVDFLTADAFEDRASLSDAVGRQGPRRPGGLQAELRALGLASGDLDLEAILDQLSEEGTIGLYVPKDKRIYMRGTELTPRGAGHAGP